MPKLPLRIEIVRSHFKHISSLSEASANEVCDILGAHYKEVIVTNIDTVDDIAALIIRKPDLVFSGIYHVVDEKTGVKIWLADELEKNNIRHTGSGKLAHRLSLNKHLAKQRMIEHGIKTANFSLARRDNTEDIHKGTLEFPLFVKPSNKSGGQGVDELSVVRTTEQLQTKVHAIHTVHLTDALVEEYLEGREFSVGIIGNKGTLELTATPIELVAVKDMNGERMLGKVIKKLNTESSFNVSDLAEHTALKKFAIESFHALGARGYGRIDVRLDSKGTIHFLEANLIPGLIGVDNYFPKSLRLNAGMNYESMLLRIVQLALDYQQVKGPVDKLTFAS